MLEPIDSVDNDDRADKDATCGSHLSHEAEPRLDQVTCSIASKAG